MPCTILLADDHTVVLEGLRRILDRAEFEVVGAVRDGRALVEAAQRPKPDIIIADVSMPLLNGVKGGVKLDHWGGEKVDHFLGSGGFDLIGLRGRRERRPAAPDRVARLGRSEAGPANRASS